MYIWYKNSFKISVGKWFSGGSMEPPSSYALTEGRSTFTSTYLQKLSPISVKGSWKWQLSQIFGQLDDYSIPLTSLLLLPLTACALSPSGIVPKFIRNKNRYLTATGGYGEGSA